MDTYRIDSDREVNHHGKIIEVGMLDNSDKVGKQAGAVWKVEIVSQLAKKSNKRYATAELAASKVWPTEWMTNVGYWAEPAAS